MKHIILIFALLSLASCGNNADPAYFGWWVYEDSSDVTSRRLMVDISADTLVFYEYSMGYDRPPSEDEPSFAEITDRGYTMSELKWERMDEPKGNAEYPTGYKITGRLETLDSQWFTPHNIYNGGHAKRGEQAFVVLYISPDGKSLVTAEWNRPHAAEYSIPYVKQPEVLAAETTDETETVQTHEIDRKPDLLLDISTHYEQEVVVLYLSSLAEDGELVGVAAVSDFYFAC